MTTIRDGQAIVIGGRNEPHCLLDLERLCFPGLRLPLAAKSFSDCLYKPAPVSGKELLGSRRYHVAVADKDGRVFVHGGEGFMHCTPVNVKNDLAVLVANPMGVRWQSTGSLRSASGPKGKERWYTVNMEDDRAVPHLTGHKALVCEGAIFMFGGFTTGWKQNRYTYKLDVLD